MTAEDALASGLGKTKTVLDKWGVPLIGVAGGYVVGGMVLQGINGLYDQIKLHDWIHKLTPNHGQVYSLINAAIFAAIGLAVIRMGGGMIIRAVGWGLIGVALRAAMAAAQNVNPYTEG